MATLFQPVMGSSSGTLAAGMATHGVGVSSATDAATADAAGSEAEPSPLFDPQRYAFLQMPQPPRHGLLARVSTFLNSTPGLAVVGIALAAATYFSGESALTLLATALLPTRISFSRSLPKPSGLFAIRLHMGDGTLKNLYCDQRYGQVYVERDGTYVREMNVQTVQHIQEFVAAAQSDARQIVQPESIAPQYRVTRIEVREIPPVIADQIRDPIHISQPDDLRTYDVQ